MSAYYNENDPFCVAWLRELIKRKLIADGTVDDRSIVEVSADDLKGFEQCHFFAGIGGWSYALRLAGWPDDRPVWTGSCPCQPFSAAGQRKGFDDSRHLWPEYYRLAEIKYPDTIFGEQVAGKDGLIWFDRVAGDLEGSGYTVGAAIVAAGGIGAPHVRKRLYFVANSRCAGWEGFINNDSISGSTLETQSRHSDNFALAWSALDDDFSGLLQRDGTTVGMERSMLHGYGNAIVPQAAKAFISAYMEIM